jgi:hypothetical protein
VGEESPALQSKPLPQPSFPPLAGHQPLGKVLGMRDDDSTPDDGDDHDHADGSFYEEQYAWDKIDREVGESRRGGCLLTLLALPVAGLLTLL